MKLKDILRYIYYFGYYQRFKKCGKNVILSRGGIILNPEELSFGNNVFISSGFRISARNLTFGDNIMIGPNVLIECDNHCYNFVGKTMFETRKKKIHGFVIVENDVWIGANVTILQNVSIKEGAVVGACSLINKDIPPYTLAAGIPARPIKPRFGKKELANHLKHVRSKYSYREIIYMHREYELL